MRHTIIRLTTFLAITIALAALWPNRPFTQSATLPGACTPPDTYSFTGTTPATEVMCIANNTWALRPRLDRLHDATDVTVGNATTAAHGLLLKLGGGTTNYLRADGTWAQPSGGGAPTRIAGSSGAAGADITWQNLTANCAANATTTLAVCMTTTGVGAGTWKFTYSVIYQAAATTTGVDFAVNHTGTVGAFVASSWYVTSGGSAANGLADQVASNTANLSEGKAARAINTKFGSTLGVDTVNANMLYVIEGLVVVTASGSLELSHASEVAASTQVMDDTSLELHKIS